ncbi:MAG: acetylornithine transaminase [Ignavibacteriales bacterium]|nr:acetylornithine transaminase [Ignavibacteriales bacterium]
MNLFEREKNAFLHTYKRIPLQISKGDGIYLYDTTGSKYMDFFSGLAVNALGYAHPRIVEAVTKQIGLFAHLSNNYVTNVQLDFTEKLLHYAGMGKAFLTNSGTEAVESAIKMVRLLKGPDAMIYSLTNDFHGRTYGALSLTQRAKYQKGFEPLLPNTGAIEFNNVDDLLTKVNGNTGAIILEFLQGEGGINEVSTDFVNTMTELREKYGFLIISDCIQCGIGRTGLPFSHNYYSFNPDAIVAAKAIGGGLPLGALLVPNSLENVFTLGKHGTTFGGNPVSCAAGLVVLEEVFENGLMEQVRQLGTYFKEVLLQMKANYPEKIKSVRGKGFMLGVELTFNGSGVVEQLFERKILSNCTNDTVIRILPPLITEKQDIDIFCTHFEDILASV